MGRRLRIVEAVDEMGEIQPNRFSYGVTTHIREGRLKVVVDAVDEEGDSSTTCRCDLCY